MSILGIEEVFEKFWNLEARSVSAVEAGFIRDLIVRYKPKKFGEIGTSAGISGGLICGFLEENGGESFHTVDVALRFIGDRSKESGFLIPEIYTGEKISVNRHRGQTSLEMEPLIGNDIDMAFIDANHQHPWPIIDTLFMLARMSQECVIIHHDLNLYKVQAAPAGIGPKYLWDQLPDQSRVKCMEENQNIFAMIVNNNKSEIADCLADAFLLPWTMKNRMEMSAVVKIRTFIEANYGAKVLHHFDVGFQRYY